MIYPLPTPIPANYQYEALRIEDLRYVPEQAAYVCEVYGIAGGQPMPLIVANSQGIQRVQNVAVTDAEIDAVLAAHPEITSRMEAGLARAMERLYTMVRS